MCGSVSVVHVRSCLYVCFSLCCTCKVLPLCVLQCTVYIRYCSIAYDSESEYFYTFVCPKLEQFI